MADDRFNGRDEKRFPALKRLGFARKLKIPFVQQATPSDCGAACLAMTLGYFGRRVSLDEVREITGYGRSGSSAASLLRAARWFGLRGRGVQIGSVEDLGVLRRGSILHWRFNHFLVFSRLTPRFVEVIDPAFGHRRIGWEEANRSFTGVALVFERSEEFVAGGHRRGMGRLWSYLRQLLLHSSVFGRVLVTSALVQVLGLAVPFFLGFLVDQVLPQADLSLLNVVGLGLLGIVLFHFLASLLRGYAILHLRTRLDAQMTLDFLEHLVALPYSFFQKRSTGDLMMRLNSHATIREMLTSGVLSTIIDGFLVTAYLVLLFRASAKMALLVVALGTLRVAIFLITRRKHRDLMSQSLHRQAESQGYQVQFLSGIETLKASGAEDRAVEHWSNLFVDSLNVSLRRGRLDAWVQSLLSALALGSPLVILVLGGHLVLSGELSLGMMLAVSALSAGFLEPLSKLVEAALQLQLAGSYLERIDDVWETPREQSDRNVRPAPRLRGDIALDGVSFRYETAQPPVVRNIDVQIQPGSFVAIVGRSGAGKSTLAGLLAGLYQPSVGRVLFDGHDLNDLDLRSVRRQLGIVPQHPAVFGHSIRSNIALLDPGLRLPDVQEAARWVELHEDIMAMPLGYDAIMANGGASLSGGQRQRIALARALARRPAILLLDEATSSLDAITEARIFERLASLRATRILIAHRLSTVRRADQILVMDSGQIVERGTHRGLMARRGIYRELVSEQVEEAGDGKGGSQ